MEIGQTSSLQDLNIFIHLPVAEATGYTKIPLRGTEKRGHIGMICLTKHSSRRKTRAAELIVEAVTV